MIAIWPTFIVTIWHVVFLVLGPIDCLQNDLKIWIFSCFLDNLQDLILKPTHSCKKFYNFKLA